MGDQPTQAPTSVIDDVAGIFATNPSTGETTIGKVGRSISELFTGLATNFPTATKWGVALVAGLSVFGLGSKVSEMMGLSGGSKLAFTGLSIIGALTAGTVAGDWSVGAGAFKKAELTDESTTPADPADPAAPAEDAAPAAPEDKPPTPVAPKPPAAPAGP